MESKAKKLLDEGSPAKVDYQAEAFGEVGCGPVCKVNYLTQRGKKVQLARILFLILIPLLGVWVFTIFSLYDYIQSHDDIEKQAKQSMKIVVRMGRLIHKLQKERDMTVLYIGKLGPGTRAFLLQNYEETDDAFANMDTWPPDFENHQRKEFRSKQSLSIYISQHRNYLDPSSTNTVDEIKFYTDIADQFMTWMIENIRESGFGSFWKSLVAYQKLTRCLLDAGTERAYGVMFYTRGNFDSWEVFEKYNKRIHSFKIHYASAVSYSPLVNPLFDDEADEINASLAINRVRAEIRRADINSNVSYKSMTEAEWFFDNMTIRVDSIFAIQDSIADKITILLETAISDIVIQIVIYGVLVFLTVAICPIIVLLSEALTNNIATYSKILIDRSSELDEEKSKSETILYQMIPKPIAERLKRSSEVDSQFFKSATLMFSSIVDFTKLTASYTPMELVEILNYLYTYFDEQIENYDVYKVETINDTYMLASGLPIPNGDRHASEIAYFAVDLAKLIHNIDFTKLACGQQLQLLIGISTGSVSAGIIGTVMLRYCIFGDTVNIASRMMTCGAPNRIHISESTYKRLKKTKNFKMQSRGSIDVKGKGHMNTYWLLDCKTNKTFDSSYALPGHVEELMGRASLCSSTDEVTEKKYEVKPSGSTTAPMRRMSYSAMHFTTSGE